MMDRPIILGEGVRFEPTDHPGLTCEEAQELIDANRSFVSTRALWVGRWFIQIGRRV